MKNIILLLLFLGGYSCTSDMGKSKSQNFECPPLFFASEHTNYIHSDVNQINLENLSYKAELNNYSYDGNCYKNNNIIYFPIDILFIIKPIELKKLYVTLPVYAALFDENDKLIEIQYFSLNKKIKKNESLKLSEEIEFIDSFKISSNTDTTVSNIVIGFMLNKKKIELISNF